MTAAVPLSALNRENLRGAAAATVTLRHRVDHMPVAQYRNTLKLVLLLGGSNRYGGRTSLDEQGALLLLHRTLLYYI